MSTHLRATPDEIVALLQKVGTVASFLLQAIDADELDRVARAFQHERDFGCFFDPSGWMSKRGTKEKNYELVRATQRFRAEVLKLMPELAEART